MEIIAHYGTLFTGLALVFAFYACWAIGANDVANAMGPPVGSGSLSIRNAVIIAAIFEFAGAFIAGGEVTATIRKGIVDPNAMVDHPHLLMYGMTSALLATALWLHLATSRGWPVSTTHTIVGAVAGFAMVGVGMDVVYWEKMGAIVASWFISPVLGGVVAYLLTWSIRKWILETNNPFQSAKERGPYYIFLVGFIVALVTFFQGLTHLKINLSDLETLLLAAVVGVACAVVGKSMINKIQVDEKADHHHRSASAEKVFIPMMIFTAAAMCFAHGSNDVANGIGPLAAVLDVVESGGKVNKSAPLPLWVLFVGGIAIVVGLATYGTKVIATIGTKITELTPSRAFSATLSAATVVVLASKTGMPVSTTHIAVGAVMGVGLARGIGALDLRVIFNIVISWLITVPAGALGAAALFFVVKGLFG
ncbi:MAG: inorganic phosphate transporter [Magnetococcales bacterium]|nr:inorganic phosphate transporter [Magnetococcales bacterium]NGZ26939.1 inorganic phosphate transporter [Magnetococcales bacterium]